MFKQNSLSCLAVNSLKKTEKRDGRIDTRTGIVILISTSQESEYPVNDIRHKGERFSWQCITSYEMSHYLVWWKKY